MKSRNPPAMLLFVRDWSLDTSALSNEEVGAYIRLLVAAWAGVPNCPPCHLPNDDARLARIAQVEPRRWRARLGEVLRAYFTPTSDGAHLFQRRQLLEFQRQLDRSAKATVGALVMHNLRRAKEGKA